MMLHSHEFVNFPGSRERVKDHLRAHLHGDPDGLGTFRALIVALPVCLLLWAAIIIGMLRIL